MEKGKVKWFNSSKGYGFIQPSSGNTDVFIHISEVEKAGLRNLAEDQAVSYEVENNQDKSSAIKLQLL
jgi:CspA family cold shock protein